MKAIRDVRKILYVIALLEALTRWSTGALLIKACAQPRLRIDLPGVRELSRANSPPRLSTKRNSCWALMNRLRLQFDPGQSAEFQSLARENLCLRGAGLRSLL